MKAIKTYGYTLGDRRRIVAATSQAEAARFFNIPASRLAKYGCETGNPEEIAICSQTIGKVFYRSTFGRQQPYQMEG